MTKNRTTVLLYALGIVTVVALAGWAAGSRIESPAEAAARTAPPTPSPILVPIEKRVLSSNVVTRGTARFGLPIPISLPPSPLKAGATDLITTLPLLNAPLKEGDVLFTASGRPVIALEGAMPAYRDLVPSSSGTDVRQLEAALKRLGFDPGPIDGTYDAATSAAVAKCYEAAGYEPFEPTLAQLESLRLLEIAAGDANKLKMAAAAAAGSAQLAVNAARAKVAFGNQTASADITAKIAERALVVLDPTSLGYAHMAADEKLEVARVGLNSAQLDGQVMLQAALDAQKAAQYDVQLMTERADRLAADLAAAKSKLGIQVPVDEIVFIPTLPGRVEAITGLVGAAATGPVLSVTDNQITVDAALPLDAAPLVKSGMAVDIDEQALGIKAKGVVDLVEKTPGTHGVDGYHIYFSVRVADTPTPLHGFSLRLTIPIESSAGEVLTVPMSALSLAADGKSRIQVQQNGALSYVTVEPGLAANGFVEIQPVDGKLNPGQLVVVGNGANDNSATATAQK